MNATGRLLHPSIGQTVDKIVNIQGHDFRFAIVELASPANEIRKQLLKLVESYSF
jgi:hypothetical protein